MLKGINEGGTAEHFFRPLLDRGSVFCFLFYMYKRLMLGRKDGKMKKQRVVVKIGSSSLTNEQGKLSEEKLSDHVAALAYLKTIGYEVILISSGAVASGFSSLGFSTRPRTMAGKQAAAAVGQGLLMRGYLSAFEKHKIVPGQILLTKEDFYSQKRFRHLFSTMTELIKNGVIPIINENDSISSEGLTFGDNDMLSALVSGFLHADALIILTDIDGLYDSNPYSNKNSKRYQFIPEVTEDLLMLVDDRSSAVGTGGMKSKLIAAQKALSLGVSVFIGTGSGKTKLADILEGKGNGTYIGAPFQTTMQIKKQWIAFHSHVKGTIEIDSGAESALLLRGKSLLPAGITNITGAFQVLDVVAVVNQNGTVIGRGQSNYAAVDLEQIKGLSSDEAMEYCSSQRPEVIHRDNWVAIGKEMH
ncbi:glutamate 5-kinase [Bacillus chungangensis]|uniref:Glutamate 5-kinase n=2 Tax=Bacillus chungangensis TaxID=587633 RepID=A0ABT9WVT4_9BACI|nr:glutamate 5-kinase [Bacillus chungangensis]